MQTVSKAQALQIQAELEDLCRKYGLWFTVQHELKPDLKMIRIQEISIKINK